MVPLSLLTFKHVMSKAPCESAVHSSLPIQWFAEVAKGPNHFNRNVPRRNGSAGLFGVGGRKVDYGSPVLLNGVVACRS